MSDLTRQAEPIVEKLLKAEESQLYEQLGIRAKVLAIDPTRGSSFEPDVTYEQAVMGPKEDVYEFGQRLFRRWNLEVYKLICGNDPEDQKDRDSLMNAFGINEVAVAAALSVLLVTQLGIAPALAVVLAALITKRFFRPGYEEFCQVWNKKLPKDQNDQ
jgi:hypothetical protein